MLITVRSSPPLGTKLPNHGAGIESHDLEGYFVGRFADLFDFPHAQIEPAAKGDEDDTLYSKLLEAAVGHRGQMNAEYR